jgi:hypothetical protein
MKWLRIADLELAPMAWGRPIRKTDVRAIGNNLDPDLLGFPVVWERTEREIGHGRFVILDGQHRCRALVDIAGFGGEQKIECCAFVDISAQDAASISLGLQERRNLHPYDHHRTAVAAGIVTAVDLEKVIRNCGLTFVRNVAAQGEIGAIAATRDVLEHIGPAGLARVLDVISASWQRAAGSYAAKVVRLVFLLVATYDDSIDDARLAKVLGKRAPNQWLADVLSPGRNLGFIAQDVVTAYNSGLRANRIQECTPGEFINAAKRRGGAPNGPKVKAERTMATDRSRQRRYAGKARVKP